MKARKDVSEKAYLKYKRLNNKYKSISILLVIVNIILLMLLVLFYYSEKNGPKIDTNCNNQSISNNSNNKINLSSDNEIVNIGYNSFYLKVISNDNQDDSLGTLFINDREASLLDYSNVVASIVDNYIIIEWPNVESGSLALGYINEKGEYYTITNNGEGVYNLYSLDGKIYGYTSAYVDEDPRKVEVLLNGSDITIINVN